MKKRKIRENLQTVERRIADAEIYIARDKNVRSFATTHVTDWRGKSGHPLWMKNHMIPTAKKARAKMEKALERIKAKKKSENPIIAEAQ